MMLQIQHIFSRLLQYYFQYIIKQLQQNVSNRTQIFAFVTAGIALTDAILAPIIGSL